MSVRVAIAAAGSGGHVFPALAVADALRERGLPQDHVTFFGGDRMEAKAVPAAGYPFVGVDIHGLRRSFSIDNVVLPLKVLRARSVIAAAIASCGLRVMVVFGGYIAGPAALAATRQRIPLVVHEANAVPGLANRMIARRASVVYSSFPATTERLGGAVTIGSPLRSAFASFDRVATRPSARAKYGVPSDGVVLAVVGGSQGAQFLNEVARVLAADPTRTFSIIHVTGPSHAERMIAQAGSVTGWIPIPFEDDMIDLYAAADVVLSRAGALTVSELQATRTPCVVVPLPAGQEYQKRNAEDLVASGGGIVVSQTSATEVADVIRSVLADEGRRTAMAAAHPTIDHASAAGTMADRILELADA
ncbi:MAG TPA: UDP-N-acetylglucosamine--N-acetylmuramyl-(pentapeptide) pyrophosphoryl-undecaprenol N-acetylglucosamine transferase [Acidimicrobiia bacterium]|nr:UDP-N-acetylglucosamine--N-acetylmuramyl-(pentapeptide) pyrophosphoryl-undecaprenol N-acetylglucosamine transferase [Acidimicrobiia bacterium]